MKMEFCMKRALFLILFIIRSVIGVAQAGDSVVSVLIGETLSWELIEKGKMWTVHHEGNNITSVRSTPNVFRIKYRICDVLYGDYPSDTLEALYPFRIYTNLPGFPIYKYSFIPIIKNNKGEYVINQMEDVRLTKEGEWVLISPILLLPNYFKENKQRVELKEPDLKYEYGVPASIAAPILVEKIKELMVKYP